MSNHIPEDWKIKTIAEIGNVVTGSTPSTKEPGYWGGKVPFISPADFDGKIYVDETERTLTETGSQKARLLPKDSILVTCIGSLGGMAMSSRESVTNQQINAVIARENQHSRFHFYNILFNIHELIKSAGTTTLPIINKSTFSQINLLTPPLPEQQKIAAVLSSVDDVIEKTRAQIDKLKDLKTGMMQELLTKGIGHTEFKDSPVGRIPVAWKVGSLESFGIDVLDGDRGKEYPKESDFYNWEYCLFLSAKNVTKTGFKFDEKAFITKEKDDALRKGKLVRGDVVITTRGTVGNTAFYGSNIPFDHIRINSGMAIIRNKTNDVAPAFLNLLMNSPMVREQVESLAFGSAQPQLTIGIIKGLIVPKPILDEQIAIAEAIESIELQIKIKANRLRALNHTKKALMQDLLTGKIRVKIDQKESAVA